MSGKRPYGIARMEIEASSTFGWQVRLQRRGVKHGKFFADGAHGGAAAALAAAREWRDALLEELEAGEEGRARTAARSARNQSGVVGVSRVRVETNGASYEFWQASWSPEPGTRKCVRFSVLRHGDREAFRLAVRARREGVGG